MAKLRLLQKVFIIYVLIILFVLSFALLNYTYPIIMERILRDEVGLVAFICFVTIQGSLELEDEDTINKDAFLFYVKFAVYVADLCLFINARVRPGLIIFACVFLLVQLALLYLDILKAYNGKETKKDPRSAGMAMILANVLALAFVMGKDFMPANCAVDGVKAVIIGGVLIFYVNVTLSERAEELLEKAGELDNANILFAGFRIVKPLVSTVIGKLKKLNKVKTR